MHTRGGLLGCGEPREGWRSSGCGNWRQWCGERWCVDCGDGGLRIACRALPGEAHLHIAAPAVEGVLRHGEDLEPAESSEVTPCGFDVTQVDTKDLGYPRELTPATADAAVGPGVVVEAAEQVAEHSGDHGNCTAAGDEA